jgi:hypothetical protein
MSLQQLLRYVLMSTLKTWLVDFVQISSSSMAKLPKKAD